MRLNAPYLTAHGVSAEAISDLEALDLSVLGNLLLEGKLAVSSSAPRVATNPSDGYLRYLKESVFRDVLQKVLTSVSMNENNIWWTSYAYAMRFLENEENDDVLDTFDVALTEANAWLDADGAAALAFVAEPVACDTTWQASADYFNSLTISPSGLANVTVEMAPGEAMSAVRREDGTGRVIVNFGVLINSITKAIALARLGVHVPILATGLTQVDKNTIILTAQRELHGLLSTVFSDHRLAEIQSYGSSDDEAKELRSHVLKVVDAALVRCCALSARVGVLLLDVDGMDHFAAALWRDVAHVKADELVKANERAKGNADACSSEPVWRADVRLRHLTERTVATDLPEDFLTELNVALVRLMAVYVRNNTTDPLSIDDEVTYMFKPADVASFASSDLVVQKLRSHLREVWEERFGSSLQLNLSSPRTPPTRSTAPSTPRRSPSPDLSPPPDRDAPLQPPSIPPPPVPRVLTTEEQTAPFASPSARRPPQPASDARSALLDAIQKGVKLKKPPSPPSQRRRRSDVEEKLIARRGSMRYDSADDVSDDDDIGACFAERVCFGQPSATVWRRTQSGVAVGSMAPPLGSSDAVLRRVATDLHDTVVRLCMYVADARARSDESDNLTWMEERGEIVSGRKDVGIEHVAFALLGSDFDLKLDRVANCTDVLDLLPLI